MANGASFINHGGAEFEGEWAEMVIARMSKTLPPIIPFVNEDNPSIIGTLSDKVPRTKYYMVPAIVDFPDLRARTGFM